MYVPSFVCVYLALYMYLALYVCTWLRTACNIILLSRAQARLKARLDKTNIIDEGL